MSEAAAEEFGVDLFLCDDIDEAIEGQANAEDLEGDELVDRADFVHDDGRDAVEGELKGDGARFGDGDISRLHQFVGVIRRDEDHIEIFLFDDLEDERAESFF